MMRNSRGRRRNHFFIRCAHMRMTGLAPGRVWHILCQRSPPLAVNRRAPGNGVGHVDDQRALVVESDPAMQRILLKYMSDRGCQAVVVRSIPDALDRLAHDSFNFTVIDLEHESMTAPNVLPDLKLQRADQAAD